MPAATPQAVRKHIAGGTPDPVYLLVGDDDVEMTRLASELSGLVEDELRAFNLERVYFGEFRTQPVQSDGVDTKTFRRPAKRLA